MDTSHVVADPWHVDGLIKLIRELRGIRTEVVRVERSFEQKIQQTHERYRPSARNLLHYLALRQRDVRQLQERLARFGLSSLGALLVGGGHQEAELKRLAAELGIENQVVFAGRVPHHEVLLQPRRCDGLSAPVDAAHRTGHAAEAVGSDDAGGLLPRTWAEDVYARAMQPRPRA